MNFFIIDPITIFPNLKLYEDTAYNGLISALKSRKEGVNIENKIVDCVEDAEIVIFPRTGNLGGFLMRDLMGTELYKRFVNRFYVYSFTDNDFPSVPGVYAAARKKYVDLGWCSAGMYLASHLQKFGFQVLPMQARDIFFSFVGSSATHPVREKICQLKHPDAVVYDSWKKGEEAWWLKSKESMDFKHNQYKDIVSRSRFSLCPRGVSPASIRLFEVMEAGSIPVIVSDDIMLPEGPIWEDFAVFIKEADVDDLPKIIEEYSSCWEERSRLARESWERYFSPENVGDVLLGYFKTVHFCVAPRRGELNKIIQRDEWLLPENLRLRARKLKSQLIGGRQK